MDSDYSPSITLALDQGDSAVIALHGAQVLSWKTPIGPARSLQEQLYLSPRAAFGGKAAIRGGIPICFPQFNARVIDQRPLPKHGFARNLAWKVQAQTPSKASLLLDQSMLEPNIRSIWPFRFSARHQVELSPGQLRVSFSVTNTDQQAWPFALALHTYLRCDDISTVSLAGLEQRRFWDAIAHLNQPEKLSAAAQSTLGFSGETDRVYESAHTKLKLTQRVQDENHAQGLPSRSLAISQSESFTETVVWTPGQALCSQMQDLPSDGYQHMLCVEAAKINTPVLLAPSQTWQGEQCLFSQGLLD